jgi:hypothetical protein
VHPFQRADSKSVSTWLLRKQNVLRYIAKKYGPAITAAREEWFSAETECNLRDGDRSNHSKSGAHNSAVRFYQRDFLRAFCAATRGPLHVSHLIRRN